MEKSTKIVVSVPMDVYFKLKERAEPLTVKQYIELLLCSLDRIYPITKGVK